MISENIAKIKENIKASGADPQSIMIVAATKTVSPDQIVEMQKFGVKDAGENRVQELLEKYDKVTDINWHFIGTLQRNKVKYIIDKVVMIHSLDSMALADEIDKRAGQNGIVMPVLVEVNIGGEASKSGTCEAGLFELCKYVSSKKNLELSGLMSVLPENAPESLYERLQKLFEKVKMQFGGSIQYLSAGMSGDYITAVRYGANIIRPGTALFGARDYGQVKAGGG